MPTDLGALPRAPERAVVINVGTDLVATLALASAARHTDMRLTLINCDATADSRRHFASLTRDLPLDIVEWPTQPHGAALDAVFRSIPADFVLLLDSDAELRSSGFIAWMRASFDHPRVFGAGYVHEAWWLSAKQRAADRVGVYHEKPWTPCLMLRVEAVREALAHDASFVPSVVYNDVRWSLGLSRLLAARFVGDPRTPRSLPSTWVRRLPASTKDRLRAFVGRPLPLRTDDEVVHFGGVTSYNRINGRRGTSIDSIHHEVAARLATDYGILPSA